MPKAVTASVGKMFDRQVANYLVAHRYLAIKSAASRTAIDVAAFGIGHVLLIQCKVNDPKLPTWEWNTLVTLADTADCLIPLVAYRDPDDAGKVLFKRLVAKRVMNKRVYPWEDYLPSIQIPPEFA